MVQAQLNNRLCPVPALPWSLLSQRSKPGPVQFQLEDGRLGSLLGTVWHICCPFSVFEGVLRGDGCFAPAPSPQWQRHPHVLKPRWKLLWWISIWCWQLAAAGTCMQRSCKCILVGFLSATQKIASALKHWVCLLTSEELLSNNVCNRQRLCFHMGVSSPFLSPHLSISNQQTERLKIPGKQIFKDPFTGGMASLCLLLKLHFHSSCSMEAAAWLTEGCRQPAQTAPSTLPASALSSRDMILG